MAKFEHIESAGFEFLVSDLDLALTLARIAARSGSNAAKRARNRKSARRAYDMVQHLADRMALTGAHRREVDHKSAKLKGELEKLGEEF